MYILEAQNLLLALLYQYRIGGVMVRMLTSSAVDRGFAPRLDQAKD